MVITDGPVDPKSRLFVGRAEELKRLQSWLASTDCVGAVMGARQTGKTSLLFKLRHTLRRKYPFVFIDLQSVEGASTDDCFGYIAAEISSQLSLQQPHAVPMPSDSREFLGFLRAVSGSTSNVRSILILDELGALPQETAMKLASTIRALFTNRIIRPEYAKYVVLLAGATDMLDLTTGRTSPLRNVTETIYLGDLTLAETERLLANALGRTRLETSPDISRHLHYWTDGHPYWTQLLAGALQQPSEVLSESRLAGIVESLLPTEDKNLPHVFRLLRDDDSLWNVIDAVMDGSSLAFSRANPLVARLELIGLVKNKNGRCAIRNRIYEEALQRRHTRTQGFRSRDLRRVAQVLAGATERDGLLRTAASELQMLLQCRSVALFMMQANRQAYSLSASVGLQKPLAHMTFAAGAPLAFLLAGPFLTATAELAEQDLSQLRQLDCVAVVPMRAADHPRGFVTLGRNLSNRAYDQHDLDFVAGVAEQVVASLERIELREIERDAAQARAIQEGLLPKTIPQIAGVQIAARWQPARIVSGDYYDVLRLNEHTLAVCIADVVGKGMPAALLASNLQAAVRTRASQAMAPHVLCDELNQLVAGNVAIGKFITFFYALITCEDRRFVYANAGHNPPVLLRASGDIRRLPVGGTVLGILPEQSYEQEVVELEPGDRVLLFTDGASEVWNAEGDELGEHGLITLFSNARRAAVDQIPGSLLNGISTFSGGHFTDDVTLVVVACDWSPMDGGSTRIALPPGERTR